MTGFFKLRQTAAKVACLAGVSFALSIGAAHADNVSVSISWNGGANVYSQGIPNTDAEPFLSTTIVATGAGASAALGALNTYCTDVFDYISNGTYQFQRGAFAAGQKYVTSSGDTYGGTWSQTQVSQLTALLYNGSMPSNNVDSAALQVAIWEIEYATESNNVYNLTSTSGVAFSATATAGTTNATLNDAQTYLNDVTNGPWSSPSGGKYVVEYLTSAPGDQGNPTQPLLYLADTSTPNLPQGAPPAVPEPASAGLLLAGLVGLAYARRRKFI